MKIYVYAEHTTRAGQVVIIDRNLDAEQYEIENANEIDCYADTEDEARERAEMWGAQKSASKYQSTCARNVLEYLGCSDADKDENIPFCFGDFNAMLSVEGHVDTLMDYGVFETRAEATAFTRCNMATRPTLSCNDEADQ
jgi:hypothetical protein